MKGRARKTASEGIWHPLCTDVLHAVYTLGVCALGLTRSSYPELPLVRSRRCPPKTRLLPTTHDRHGRSTHVSCNDGIYARCMRVHRMYYFPLHSCSVVPGLHSLAATHIFLCVRTMNPSTPSRCGTEFDKDEMAAGIRWRKEVTDIAAYHK